MAETWPAELPCRFLRGTQAGALGDNLLKGQTETGPGKVRPRSSAAVGKLAGRMRMTTAQKAALVSFYKETLLEGSLAFTMPVMGEAAPLLLRFKPGTPPEWVDTAPGRWEVSLEFEVMP